MLSLKSSELDVQIHEIWVILPYVKTSHESSIYKLWKTGKQLC